MKFFLKIIPPTVTAQEHKVRIVHGSKEYRILLEKRYLCYESWKKISDDMGFGIDNIFKMHGKVLLEIKIPKLYS